MTFHPPARGTRRSGNGSGAIRRVSRAPGPLDSEIKKTRPCLIVSPDELNRHVATVIVAPMTTKGRTYPTRVPCLFEGKKGEIVLDQLRTVDRTRLIKRLGRVDAGVQKMVLTKLAALFAA